MFFKVQILILLFGLRLYSGDALPRFEIQNEYTKEIPQFNITKSNDLTSNERPDIGNDFNEDDTAKERFKRKIYDRPSIYNQITRYGKRRSLSPRNNLKVIKRIPKAVLRNLQTSPNGIHMIKRKIIQTSRPKTYQKTKRQNPHPKQTLAGNLLSLIHGIKKNFKNKITNFIGQVFGTSASEDEPKGPFIVGSTEATKFTTELTTVKNIASDEKIIEESLDKLLRTEVFWDWLTGWTTGYGKLLKTHVKYFVQDEVAKQVDKKCDDSHDVPIIKDKDEVTALNNTVIEQNKDTDNDKNVADSNKQKDTTLYDKPINIKVDTVYGNAVDSDHVTNIFVFYPNDTSKFILYLNKTMNITLDEEENITAENKLPIDDVINGTEQFFSTENIVTSTNKNSGETKDYNNNVITMNSTKISSFNQEKTTESIIGDQMTKTTNDNNNFIVDTSTELVTEPNTGNNISPIITIDKFNDEDNSTSDSNKTTTVAIIINNFVDSTTESSNAQFSSIDSDTTQVTDATTTDNNDSTETTNSDLSTEIVTEVTTEFIDLSSQSTSETDSTVTDKVTTDSYTESPATVNTESNEVNVSTDWDTTEVVTTMTTESLNYMENVPTE